MPFCLGVFLIGGFLVLPFAFAWLAGIRSYEEAVLWGLLSCVIYIIPWRRNGGFSTRRLNAIVLPLVLLLAFLLHQYGGPIPLPRGIVGAVAMSFVLLFCGYLGLGIRLIAVCIWESPLKVKILVGCLAAAIPVAIIVYKWEEYQSLHERRARWQAEADRWSAREQAEAQAAKAFRSRVAAIIRERDWASLDAEGAAAVPVVVASLSSPQETKLTRVNAAEALGRLRNARGLGPLVAALEDQDGDVQEAAAISLGQIGDVRAVAPLSLALEQTSVGVKPAIISALVQIGDDGALDSLSRCANIGPTPDIRRAASEAREQIKAKSRQRLTSSRSAD